MYRQVHVAMENNNPVSCNHVSPCKSYMVLNPPKLCFFLQFGGPEHISKHLIGSQW